MNGACKSSPILKLNLDDWTKGLIMAVIGAALGVVYDVLQKGLPSDWVSAKSLLVTAAGAAILAAVAYILKNLGTGSGGQLLTNQPKEEVKDVEKKS